MLVSDPPEFHLSAPGEGCCLDTARCPVAGGEQRGGVITFVRAEWEIEFCQPDQDS